MENKVNTFVHTGGGRALILSRVWEEECVGT